MKSPTFFTLRALPGLTGRVMLILASLVALYLSSISLSQTSVAGCDDGSGCHAVLSSRWAYLFGLPASFPAIAVYLVAVLAAGAFEARDTRTWLGMGGQVALLLITVASVWYLYLQFVALRQFCPWCCLAHLLGLGGVFLLTWSRLLHPPADETDPQSSEARVLRNNGLMGFAKVGAVAAGILAMAIGPFINSSVSEMTSQITGSNIAQTGELDTLTLTLHSGKTKLHPSELPLIGDITARHFAVALVDYTCEHCRNYHATLEQVTEDRKGDLAIVLLPAARDDEAMQVQQTMLCLFRADRPKHDTLATQLLTGTQPATAAAVKLCAISMLGEAEWASAEAKYGAWAAERIQLTKNIRESNRDVVGSGRLPQLMAGSEILVGYYADAVKVGEFIDRGLKVPESHDAALATSGALETAAPGLTAVQPVTSLGEVKPSSKVRCEVEVENRGPAPMTLSWVALDPGCEVASLPHNEMAPGGKIKISILVETPAEASSFQRKIVVHGSTGQPLTTSIHGRVGGIGTSPFAGPQTASSQP